MMAEISELRAKHRALIAQIAALVADFERETGLRVRAATVVRDEHELAKLLGGVSGEDVLNFLSDGRTCTWIVPHAEV